MRLIKDLLKTVVSLLFAFFDFITLIRPCKNGTDGLGFAFLVHPRDIIDIYRPFPFFKYLPQSFVMRLVTWLPPITLSKITGLKSTVTGECIPGYLLSIVLTPIHMRKNLPLVLKRIRQMAVLAKKKGVKLIGLGALLPSLTHYGKTFRYELGEAKKAPFITTGHAYTAYTVVSYLNYFLKSKKFGSGSEITVAIVGAAGSTGSLCAKLIASRMLNTPTKIRLLLVDLQSKEALLKRLSKELTAQSIDIKTECSFLLEDLVTADFIITVTNALRSIIQPKHIKPGQIIIDDSQPRNTSPDLCNHGAWVVDVLARFPGINCNFDFGFVDKNPEIVFTCLAELAVLASSEYNNDFSMGFVELDVIKKLRLILDKSPVEIAPIHSFTRALSESEIEQILA